LEISEIISKVKHLEIVSKKLTQHLFAGEYHSAFKGRGMSFKEVREYQHGDDTRFIDWNVSARMDNTYSKVYEEEREITVHFLVDVSSSTLFGTQLKSKKELIAELCAVIAFAALKNNDKLSLTLFGHAIEKYIPANKGKKHVLHMVRNVLTYASAINKTNIAGALHFINNISKQKSIIFIISDFIDHGFENELKATAKKHDVIGIKVYDAMDVNLPRIGLLAIRDLESGSGKLVNTNHAWVQNHYKNQFVKHTEAIQNIFNKAKSDLLHLQTDENYVKVLQQFFLKRLKK
jgi:uncharacterized protein (DUF58 family)